MSERILILGTPIDNFTMAETLNKVEDAIQNKKHIHHTVVNAGKIVSMHENKELRESVVNANIINADGQAVVWASKLFGKGLKERVAGIDLMENLVALAHKKGYRIFFLWGKRQCFNKNG
jgi:N-acetylglucosaminyldiphosphoundecaprenol N-acetyl-beta-D-mannosaminyltransferase